MLIKTSIGFLVADEERVRVRIRFTDFCSGPARRLSGGLARRLSGGLARHVSGGLVSR